MKGFAARVFCDQWLMEYMGQGGPLALILIPSALPWMADIDVEGCLCVGDHHKCWVVHLLLT